MFDPRIPYQRRMWHYESDRPLSVAQLIAAGSLDAPTAALLWLLIERHQSLIVSGPTDPTPGVGKTTTLNALLGFLPAGSTLVYTMGMYEDFDFVSEVTPATTCVLANEVSDHLRIYMWGRVARKLLNLPESGFAIASSCHADTIQDVMNILVGDLRLDADDIRRLGVIVNIGLVGRAWPQRRRFLTVHFVRPTTDPDHPDQVALLPLSQWDATTDTFTSAEEATQTALATIIGMAPDEMQATLTRRASLLERLGAGRGVGVTTFREAVDDFYAEEHGLPRADSRSAVKRAVSSSDDDDEEQDDDEDQDDDEEQDEE